MGKNFYDEITLNEEQRGENFFDEVTPRSKSSCKASNLSGPEDNSGRCLQFDGSKFLFTKKTDGYDIPILI